MSKREFKSNGANSSSSSSSSSSSKKCRLFPGDIPTGNPNELASALLRWLPEDATMKTKSSKDRLRAFDLVKAKLQHRTNLMAESNVEEGGRIELIFCGIAIPPDVFRTILSFVSPPQTGSLVAKNWLAATRSPHFWHTLDAEHGLLYQSMTVRNMTDLLNLLSRPQFSSLRVLVPPDKVQMRAKALEQIAKACPNLEEFDLGFSLWSSMKVDDKALLALPELFPHLKGVRFGTHRVTVSGMVQFCEKMGDRLISLRMSLTRF
jgi:hypothetical protein